MGKVASAALVFIKAHPLLTIGVLSASAASATAAYYYKNAEGVSYEYKGTD